MSDPVQLLKDLITATSVSLSPAVAWATFVSNFMARQQNRVAEVHQILTEVKKELDFITPWAENEYEDSHDDRSWGQPLWSVNDFPSNWIHEFNRVAYALPVDNRLRGAMAALETAIARFRSLLRAHQEFVRQDRGRKALAVAANQDEDSKEWLDRLYKLNKDIHVKGIGNARDPDKLHSAWKKALAEVNGAISGPVIIRHPNSLWLGHILAVILGIIGFGFLFSFIYVFLNPAWLRHLIDKI